jgi:hypothetical protein
VTVRVVREAIGNNIVGQSVTLTVAGATRTATTDEMGRAEFTGLSEGAAVRAEATVDGEALTSDSFTVPSSGGLRVILVAGLAAAKARADEQAAADAAAPPVKGAVVLGPNSRIVLEFQDDVLRMFYVLDILNSARARVDIGGPLIIDLPEGAAGAVVLQGSSPNAIVSGDRLTVTGPFAAGITSVQVGFTLQYNRADLEVEQRWPVPLQQLTVAAQKLGALALSSPQLTTVGEIKAESGTPFLLGSGPAVPAGGTVVLRLSNLPVHSRVPRVVALALALAILAVGAWAAFGARSTRDTRAQMVSQRDALLGELASIDRRERNGTPSGRDRQRRPEVVAELERLYGELDDAATDLRGGGGDLAA